jgi:hypothetical protein
MFQRLVVATKTLIQSEVETDELLEISHIPNSGMCGINAVPFFVAPISVFSERCPVSEAAEAWHAFFDLFRGGCIKSLGANGA